MDKRQPQGMEIVATVPRHWDFGIGCLGCLRRNDLRPATYGIKRVAYERIARRREVNADLVGAARANGDLD